MKSLPVTHLVEYFEQSVSIDIKNEARRFLRRRLTHMDWTELSNLAHNSRPKDTIYKYVCNELLRRYNDCAVGTLQCGACASHDENLSVADRTIRLFDYYDCPL